MGQLKRLCLSNSIKTAILQEITDVVTTEEVPSDFMFNWDQTRLNLVPALSWTMAVKRSKQFEIKGLRDECVVYV